ncbi:MAG: lysine--tRNA ligase [Pseudanabaenaceae cyanobacterium bins.68]|nr:lysine--tRNA ligase [Pseudanabaenaceae cyanobacterium bins.68]
MFWAEKLAADLTGTQVVNDSKTPSGRVHVGSLRGVIIHDVIYRSLQHLDKPVRFLYGADDYDALDTVPRYLDQERFSPYLGFPLCNVPAPQDTASDYAKYFMQEFLEVFDYLGVRPEVYYLRDFYRMGKLNPYIDLFLRQAALVREAYLRVSGGKRAEDWYPFQPICENCGKIATTVVSDYNGAEVFYHCKGTNYVKGCNHRGWVSPFDGRGKLPWKVEWVAKWDLLGVTVEMAGKDHSQKGGSREVANAICESVLGKPAPFHSPYEFILVNGTKMSSSKGVGSGAKEIADLLPAELLRFLMLRTQPRTVINFSPNYETITRLFRDYDLLVDKAIASPDLEGDDLAALRYAQVKDWQSHQTFDLSTIISLLQLPHLDIEAELERRIGKPLSDRDWQVIRSYIATARQWLRDYADEEEKLEIYLERLPERAKEINGEQANYLHVLASRLEAIASWEAEPLQTEIFALTRELNLSQKEAFKAIYLCFLNKERGPKAGSLFSFLERQFVLQRLRAVDSCLNAEA